ncbi:50S ribosomal protein L10 [Candidatus Phytoplasma oryzae]|nr:50S ribosomal protein L10 [Candidatus Phytoplasma oryzae]
MLKNIIEKKKEHVKTLVNDINNSKIFLLFEYIGCTVQDFTELRAKLRKFDSKIKLYPNNIIKRALDKIDFKNNNINLIKYPKGIILSSEENNKVFKILFDFAKNNKFLKIISGFINKKFYSKEMIYDLSMLPTKEELISNIVSNLLMPVREFIFVLDILSKNIKK